MANEKFNELFENCDLSQITPQQMMASKKLYDYIIETHKLAEAKHVKFDEVLDGGLFGALIGGTVAATVGQSIMKACVKILGIDPKGTLGKLLTSQLVLSALGAELGYRW